MISNNQQIEKKMVMSAKWSTLGEVLYKLIAPITNMILARLLIPEDFGVVATVTMVISFADIFTDAGFQKYLIQADIREEELDDFAAVAFWTNLAVSCLIWLIIYMSRYSLSKVLSLEELVSTLPLATITIIISSFTTIQIALFRRNFQFKKLFIIRVIGAIVPIAITVPLAFMGFRYWSIIIGNIVLSLLNAIILTSMSHWKPRFFYKFSILKNMFSFSMWSLLEAISIWMTSWIDNFIISTRLNSKKLGVYRTSTTTINGIMSMITGATTPILFSGLSKLKDEEERFFYVFLKMQKYVAILVLPLGVGIYVFRSFARMLFLGSGWEGAELVIGNWALTSALMIIFGNYCSEVYRAKGRPRLSFIAQILHLIFLVPVVMWSVGKGFEFLVMVRSWSRLQFVLIHFIFMDKYFNLKFMTVLRNVKSILISSMIMGLSGYLMLRINTTFYIQIIWIMLCIIIYFMLLLVFRDTRVELISIIKLIKKRNEKE